MATLKENLALVLAGVAAVSVAGFWSITAEFQDSPVRHGTTRMVPVDADGAQLVAATR